MIMPKWESAPAWAFWLAQNYDGEFWWLEDKPRNLGHDWPVWRNDYRAELASKGKVNPNWERAIWKRW